MFCIGQRRKRIAALLHRGAATAIVTRTAALVLDAGMALAAAKPSSRSVPTPTQALQ